MTAGMSVGTEETTGMTAATVTIAIMTAAIMTTDNSLRKVAPEHDVRGFAFLQ